MYPPEAQTRVKLVRWVCLWALGFTCLSRGEHSIRTPVTEGSAPATLARGANAQWLNSEHWVCFRVNDFTIGNGRFLWKPFQVCLVEMPIVTISVHGIQRNSFFQMAQFLGRNDGTRCHVWSSNPVQIKISTHLPDSLTGKGAKDHAHLLLLQRLEWPKMGRWYLRAGQNL